MRIKIQLRCQSCGGQNYISSKNPQSHPDRIEVLKYCPKERQVTTHQEMK
ncbi:50S ribosomal protein L33 [Streptococcus sp. 121]|nr:50S ribosomal protein L33 [Streptococcus sp. 121]MBJ6746334.1 50S ribosomal protein L33 [Streptococcus sp. 121]